MTQKQQAIAYVSEFMELDVELPKERCSDADKYSAIDLQTAKRIALIMVQKLQDANAKPPNGYTSSFDYWEGIKNEIKAL